MKIKQTKVKLRDIVKGYQDLGDKGVFAMDGNLNIRPAYQREFVYKEAQRNKVIETIMNGYPLSSMYWSKNADGTYEVMDGQQRTISACSYHDVQYSVEYRQFNNLTIEEQEKFLDYEFDVNICEGTEAEKLEWFKVINIAGEKLTAQELRNAIYTGTWLTDAKKKFSKPECPAYKIGSPYLKGSPIRQDYLETALKWIIDITEEELKDVEEYMAKHQHDVNANELWRYFEDVIQWVERNFPTYRKEMKGVNWGYLYEWDTNITKAHIPLENREAEIKRLMMDEEITNRKGIFPYVITGDEKYLNLRAFPPKIARAQFEEQKGICIHCAKVCEFHEMEADHITPWIKGGKTDKDNCQMLCIKCNRRKGGR